ncbi:Adenylate kinase 2 [Entomophthora muscae]|nr:Adenylate kinase 2 [Entomophthora muscae]
MSAPLLRTISTNRLCNVSIREFSSSAPSFKMATTIQPSPLRMLLIGAPGAGKGTQSSRINKDFGLEAISSGDVLRRHIKNGTPAGKMAKDLIKTGMLLPDNIMLAILQSELEQLSKKNWLLDGFPRNVAQAQALDSRLDSSNDMLNLVVHLDVPEDVILGRIMDRWVHVPSGRVYNLGYNPPKVPGLDDVTGEPLSKREDDCPESLKRRLDQFKELTTPLLEFYDKKNVLVTVSGPTSDIIYPQIHKEISRRLFRL